MLFFIKPGIAGRIGSDFAQAPPVFSGMMIDTLPAVLSAAVLAKEPASLSRSASDAICRLRL